MVRRLGKRVGGPAYWRIGVRGSKAAFRHRYNDHEVSTELMMLCKRRHADTPIRRYVSLAAPHVQRKMEKQDRERASAPIAQERVRRGSKKKRRDVQRRTRGSASLPAPEERLATRAKVPQSIVGLGFCSCDFATLEALLHKGPQSVTEIPTSSSGTLTRTTSPTMASISE